ncbi:MAG: hydantoinase/oxoprolinase N-terminal domain-containing protein, partial [Acidobacteriota bacterium]
MLRIGIDTGGTFTDLFWMEAGRHGSCKVLSTPEDPSRAVLSGLRALLGGRLPAAPGKPTPAGPGEREMALPPGSAVVHGTTVATNALLEGRGAPVALLATAGFEDLLEIGRQDRPSLYDPSVMPAPPLVPRRCRYGIPGRLGPDGQEESPLDLESVEEAVRAALTAGSRGIAICFLHAYAHPGHEEEAARIVSRLGGDATLSSRVLPEYREYERTSTTVVSAALK